MARFSDVGAIVIKLMPSPRLAGLIDCFFEETTSNVIFAALDQVLSARSTDPITSLSGVILAEGNVNEVERAIWMVFVFHFICNSGETDGSNEDGWIGMPKANIASNARIGFARRISENRVNSKGNSVGEIFSQNRGGPQPDDSSTIRAFWERPEFSPRAALS